MMMSNPTVIEMVIVIVINIVISITWETSG